MDFLPYLWLLAGILLIGLELVAPGFVIVFFGLGALVTGLLSLLIPGLSGAWIPQLIIWGASSLLSLGLLRRFFKNTFRGKVIEDDGSDDYVGQFAEVTEPISAVKPGRVKFQGTSWKAMTFDTDLVPGDTVEIMKKDNLTLMVSKRE
jgi:membrane protein implicated in regulation of membrane protease activity